MITTPKTSNGALNLTNGARVEFTVDASVNLQPYIEEGSAVESSGRGRLPPDNISYAGVGVFTVHPL